MPPCVGNSRTPHLKEDGIASQVVALESELSKVYTAPPVVSCGDLDGLENGMTAKDSDGPVMAGIHDDGGHGTMISPTTGTGSL